MPRAASRLVRFSIAICSLLGEHDGARCRRRVRGAPRRAGAGGQAGPRPPAGSTVGGLGGRREDGPEDGGLRRTAVRRWRRGAAVRGHPPWCGRTERGLVRRGTETILAASRASGKRTRRCAVCAVARVTQGRLGALACVSTSRRRCRRPVAKPVRDRVRLALGVADLAERDGAVRDVDGAHPGVLRAPDVVEEPVADEHAGGRVGRRPRPPSRPGTPAATAWSTGSRWCRRRRRAGASTPSRRKKSSCHSRGQIVLDSTPTLMPVGASLLQSGTTSGSVWVCGSQNSW